MTAFFENIRKTMGWCPNANALATKRVMVALPIDEEFAPGGKGKSIQNYGKMGWANIYRNFVLLQTVLGVVFFGLNLFIIKYLSKMDFNYVIILKGILIGIVFSVFFIIYTWRGLNRVNQQKISTRKKIFIQVIQVFSIIGIFFSIIMLLVFTIGKDDPFQFFVSMFFPQLWIHYPLVVYWERKNKKTIYLVEEKLLRWRPVALPGQAPEKG